jgi:hypothetical protein
MEIGARKSKRRLFAKLRDDLPSNIVARSIGVPSLATSVMEVDDYPPRMSPVA